MSSTTRNTAPQSVRFVDVGAYPTRDGNSITPWIDGEPAFRRICEAIEGARTSVWATVTFMWPAFQMPDGRGSALDVLEAAARRGVDVRVIFWRPDDATASLRTNAFWGSPEHFESLAKRRCAVNIRWDRAHPGYCQHQKTWLIDAGDDSATSFVGGINLNPHSLVRPDHQGAGQNHDVYIEVMGPAVADVHHNFVQRWNEVSERGRDDGWWGVRGNEDLPYPTDLPACRGTSRVQIQRTMHAGRYHNDHPAPGAPAFPIALGEATNSHQYMAAIRGAQRTIYLEHQHLEVLSILDALDDALTRGVRVVAMLPVGPLSGNALTSNVSSADVMASRARLARHERFTLAGMAGQNTDGIRVPVHVHSKLILVDDEWASVGSCNLHHYSMTGNAELNAAFHDPAVVRALRAELFREHLGKETLTLEDTSAFELFQDVARANLKRYHMGDHRWEGLAVALAR